MTQQPPNIVPPTLQSELYDWLKEQRGLCAEIGGVDRPRLYWDRAPKRAETPYVVATILADPEVRHATGVSDVRQPTLQLSFWDRDRDGSKLVGIVEHWRQVLRSMIRRPLGNIAQATFFLTDSQARPQPASDGTEDVRQRIWIQYRVWYATSPSGARAQ